MRILCWSISVMIFIGWGIGRLLHPGNSAFPYHVLKHALDIFFINISVAFFIWPFLISNGFVGENYHEENEIGKAKITLALSALVLPGLLLVFISAWITKIAVVPVTLITLLYAYAIMKNSYIYFGKGQGQNRGPGHK